MSLMRTYTSLFQSDEIAWIIYQNAHLHPTSKMELFALKNMYQKSMLATTWKTTKVLVASILSGYPLKIKIHQFLICFLFGKFPIPFWIKINFDKRTVIERQVLTNKTDAIKVLLKNYLNNLCQNPFFGWFSFSWYSIRVLFVSVNLCSAINCNCCAWSICLSFSLICDFK